MNARIDKMQNSPVPFFLHFLCWTRNTNLITLFNFKAVVSKVRAGDSYSFWSKVLSKRRKPQINQCPFRGLWFEESSTTPDLKLLIALELFLNHWYQNIESFAAWITDTYMTSTLPGVKKNVLTSVSHCIRHPLIKSCPLTSSIKDGRSVGIYSSGDNFSFTSVLSLAGVSLIAAFVATQRQVLLIKYIPLTITRVRDAFGKLSDVL